MPILSFSREHQFLSNFYPSSILYEGLVYPTSEHAYQAAKSDNPNNKLTISNLGTPGKAKRFGKKVELRPDWDDVKLDEMKKILRIKFANVLLAHKLIGTGEEELIEGNLWGDTFWGICRGRGENNLGKILMEIRGEIKNA